MVQTRLGGSDFYDKTNIDSILARAAKLTGHTLNEFIESGEVIIGGTATKGYFGQIVEEGYFLLDNNNSPEPDFKEARLELKVTPMKKIASGYVSKERLILGIINYNEVPERGFNIFLDKDSHLLIVFYLWEKDTDIFEYRFLKVVDWKPTHDELRIIKEDWDIIEGYVMRGEAHILSGRHTKYLEACTKGVGHGKDFRTQPFSEILAKQRALAFKASFMTDLFETHDDVGRTMSRGWGDSESIIHGYWSPNETFEEHVLAYFTPYIGKTCAEIEFLLGTDLNPESKQYYSTLALAMAGVKRKKHAKEFVTAGIEMKTIRIRVDGKPKESMSFPYIDFDELVTQKWKDSDFYGQLDHMFFSPVFAFTEKDTKSQSRRELIFKGAFFWTVPDPDFEIIREVWEDTKSKVLREDFDHFIKMSENPISHIRPHARNLEDTASYKGRPVKKVCFWLKDTYIQKIVEDHLGKEFNPPRTQGSSLSRQSRLF